MDLSEDELADLTRKISSEYGFTGHAGPLHSCIDWQRLVNATMYMRRSLDTVDQRIRRGPSVAFSEHFDRPPSVTISKEVASDITTVVAIRNAPAPMAVAPQLLDKYTQAAASPHRVDVKKARAALTELLLRTVTELDRLTTMDADDGSEDTQA